MPATKNGKFPEYYPSGCVVICKPAKFVGIITLFILVICLSNFQGEIATV